MRKITKATLVFTGILFLAFLMGPKPTHDGVFVKPLPEVPAEMESLNAFVEAAEDQIPNIRPNSRSKIIFADSIPKKTPYSVVYFHGFTATSKEGDPFHLDVAKGLGANLYLPRFYNHGLQEEEPMLNFNLEAYLESAREALAIASRLGEKVIILATSNGATLALTLGDLPQVAAMGLYSPNIKIKDPRAFIATLPWGVYLLRAVFGGDYFYLGQMTPAKKEYWTWKVRLEAGIDFQYFLETAMTKTTFSKIKVPVYMGYYYKNDSLQDNTVRVEDMLVMFDQLGTPTALKKKQAFPEAADHVLTSYLSTNIYPEVTKATLDFLKHQLALPMVSKVILADE